MASSNNILKVIAQVLFFLSLNVKSERVVWILGANLYYQRHLVIKLYNTEFFLKKKSRNNETGSICTTKDLEVRNTP